MRKKTVVIHSGGMDSSICLALAKNEFGNDKVTSLLFLYDQRHQNEVEQAKKICAHWEIDHHVISLPCVKELTDNALVDSSLEIQHAANEIPNSFVMGRNGLMARLGALFAHKNGANSITMGVLELETANSGYPDCSRTYMDLMEKILRIDIGNPDFEIRTPIINLTKYETLEIADKLGVLSYLLRETVTCYLGIQGVGCSKCPACILKNAAVSRFYALQNS